MGTGHNLQLALLANLWHECHALAVQDQRQRVQIFTARKEFVSSNYEEHYLHAAPILYKGMSFFPRRHNREFTKSDLEILLRLPGIVT